MGTFTVPIRSVEVAITNHVKSDILLFLERPFIYDIIHSTLKKEKKTNCKIDQLFGGKWSEFRDSSFIAGVLTFICYFVICCIFH